MPRPKNKEHLLSAMETEHESLEKVVIDLTPEQIIKTSTNTNYSIKDVLAHLYEWEQMCLGWYEIGMLGKTPALPAEGYNWAQIPALNKAIYEKHKDKSFDEIQRLYRESYTKIHETITSLSEAELFSPGHYAWTKKNALAAYFIGATSSHYLWAKKEVKNCLKR